jgi:hypothetical protein
MDEAVEEIPPPIGIAVRKSKTSKLMKTALISVSFILFVSGFYKTCTSQTESSRSELFSKQGILF